MSDRLLILGERDVRDLLPMAECIEVMASALRALADDRAVQPLRTILRFPDSDAWFGLMPAYDASAEVFGCKAVSAMPENAGTRWDTHLGAVLLFDRPHGRPIALLEGNAITAIRTAAVSAVATRALAREAAGDLALLGCGVQARSHLEAMLAVRPVRRVRVWARSPERAARFAARAAEELGHLRCEIEVATSAIAAIDGADLICTTTGATRPVVDGEALAPGVHINAIGACVPTARELDSRAVGRARLFTDRRESLFAEAGDFLIPLRAGEIGDDHLRGELGDVLTGRVPGRTAEADITLFESLGLGIEDVAAAAHAYRAAVAAGRGVAVDFSAGGPQ